MHHRMRKVYGQSGTNACIFCGTNALRLNTQGFPVCTHHQQSTVDMDQVKCACGSYLDIKEGKFGAFFLCINCGPRSVSKIKELNTFEDTQTTRHVSSEKKEMSSSIPKKTEAPHKEYTITTDDVDYFS